MGSESPCSTFDSNAFLKTPFIIINNFSFKQESCKDNTGSPHVVYPGWYICQDLKSHWHSVVWAIDFILVALGFFMNVLSVFQAPFQGDTTPVVVPLISYNGQFFKSSQDTFKTVLYNVSQFGLISVFLSD